MAEVYTAKEMSDTAMDIEAHVVMGSIDAFDSTLIRAMNMLRQAADLMEREEKREKKYEYGVMSNSRCEGVYDSHLHARLKMDLLHICKKECDLVRREVGEWEEVSEVCK